MEVKIKALQVISYSALRRSQHLSNCSRANEDNLHMRDEIIIIFLTGAL